MVRLGLVIFFGAILASMTIAIYAYYLYQPSFITVNEGQPVQVGPVKYVINYEGQFEGNEKVKPEHSFFKIRINAENLGTEPTRISGIQFFLIDENGTKTEPVFGNFSEEDLLNFPLEPGKPVSYTTQFDVPFYEDKQYKIGIQPRKEQKSRDIAIICLLNCN